jgi:hypothetical protein
MSATAAKVASDALATLSSCTGTARSRDGCAEQHKEGLAVIVVLGTQGDDGARITPATSEEIELEAGLELNCHPARTDPITVHTQRSYTQRTQFATERVDPFVRMHVLYSVARMIKCACTLYRIILVNQGGQVTTNFLVNSEYPTNSNNKRSDGHARLCGPNLQGQPTGSRFQLQHRPLPPTGHALPLC